MSIEKRVNKAKKGNEKAFQALIEIEKRKLYRIAYLYVKKEEDALDVVQETICKAFISIKQLKDAAYFSTWITRILINTAIDYLKKKNCLIPSEETDQLMLQPHLHLEEKLDLADAISRLDEMYKTVIIYRYYKDLSIKQIAEILNCPEGTVKTRLHRAIMQLKTELGEECI